MKSAATGGTAASPRRRAAVYDLENSVGYLLNRAAHIVAARVSDDLLPYEINLQTWRVLAALSHQAGQSLTELANHTGAELSYLSRAVVAAERRGLVQRLPSPSDRRTLLLSLAPAGRKLVAKLVPRAERIEQAGLAGVSATDYEVTRRTLAAISNNLVSTTEGLPVVNRKLTVARRVRQRAEGGAPR